MTKIIKSLIKCPNELRSLINRLPSVCSFQGLLKTFIPCLYSASRSSRSLRLRRGCGTKSVFRFDNASAKRVGWNQRAGRDISRFLKLLYRELIIISHSSVVTTRIECRHYSNRVKNAWIPTQRHSSRSLRLRRGCGTKLLLLLLLLTLYFTMLA